MEVKIKEFEKPNIECLEINDDNNYAKFVCEPLERGYGVTIGNSLRRILLSSLPGSAITSTKITILLISIFISYVNPPVHSIYTASGM